MRIFGEMYDVRAEVVSIPGLSAHAGQDMLLRYALASKESLKQVMLTHGEPDAAAAFRALLLKNGIDHVDYPQLHEAVDLSTDLLI